jgi:hypothetical protein|tara:strand:- start:4179 stop:4397 length:219 start_codon:yes stop_codon:yes gene_type:complete
MDISKGKTTVAEVAPQQDLTVSDVGNWIGEPQRNMENGFKARPKDIREHYETELRDTKRHWGRPSPDSRPKK